MKDMGYWNNKENCLNECKKYETRNELRENSCGCYASIIRNKWIDEFYPNKKEVKPYSWWNDKNHCIDEARKYNNKWDLQQRCMGCYNGLRRNGWLDEVSDMLYDDSIHYMQYNEKINVVYVYEFETFKTCYVGRTNKLKRRDRQHRNGYGHKNGVNTYDSVHDFAVNNSLEIPKPKILEENLTALESQDLEDKWKKKYIEDGWSILNKAATGIGKGSLGASLKWTYEACLEESKKYRSKNQMKIKNQSAYNSSVKNGWINEFFENKKYPDGYWDSLENILNAAKQCKGAKDMIKKFGGAYNHARKHGWLDKLEYKKEE